jgi:hypothetical protein
MSREGNEFRIVEVILPGEAHEPLQGGNWLVALQFQLGLGGAEVAVGVLKGFPEQRLLVAKVVI